MVNRQCIAEFVIAFVALAEAILDQKVALKPRKNYFFPVFFGGGGGGAESKIKTEKKKLNGRRTPICFKAQILINKLQFILIFNFLIYIDMKKKKIIFDFL